MRKFAAILFPLAFLAAPTCAATLPGAIPGSVSVTESGAAAYNIPIAIPPGTAGMEPKLSLNYSSQSGNGIAGVGWSLGGLSAITRCTVDRAPNTSVRVTFTATDRFCLDGQKLVAISGTYGASGTEYRTERESFSKVISSGAAGSGPASFKVWTKAGLIMEFGVTSDARILAEGKAEARVWALNKISDTSGNYLTVAYTQDAANADYVPTRIDYTGNAAAGVAPYNKVELVYETRPDPSTGYAAGVRVGQAQRLTHVLAYAGATLVSDYTLGYDTAPVTQRSRLASLTRCAGDGNCLAPTQFTWLDGQLASYAADQETVTPAGTVNDLTFALGDMNADGRTDALIFDTRTSTFRPFHAQGENGMEARSSVTASISGSGMTSPVTLDKRLWLGDVNGDGRAEPLIYGKTYTGSIIYYEANTWRTQASGNVYGANTWLTQTSGDISSALDGTLYYGQAVLYNPSRTLNNTAFSSAGHERWFYIGDSNADGKADFTAYLPTIANYGGSSSNHISRPYVDDANTLYGAVVADSTTPAQSFFENADVNGDGLPDALRYDPTNGLLRVWRSNGTGLSATPLSQTLISGSSPLNSWFQAADINGDGLGDLILHTPANGQLRSWLAKGDGTFIAGSISGLSTGGLPADTWFQMVDINTDGRADAVKYSPASGNLAYALSLGDGGFDALATVYLGSGPLPTPHIGSAPYTQWFSPAASTATACSTGCVMRPKAGASRLTSGRVVCPICCIP